MANLSIQGIVDLAREAVREISDDSNYPDKYLFRIILEARAQLLDQMKKQNKELSPWLYQRFCLKLCPSTFIECGCAPFGCGLCGVVGCVGLCAPLGCGCGLLDCSISFPIVLL